MKRAPEVIDAWFDSGSMPFAQWHYPFENSAMLEQRFPADFIAEGVDQTRGWFYSLLAIATGLGRCAAEQRRRQAAPYRAVVVNDMVLDAKGAEDVEEPRQHRRSVGRRSRGTASMRCGCSSIASSKVWVPRRFDESMIRDRRDGFCVTLKNVYSGIFAQYANFGWSPSRRIRRRPTGR